jgi:hypothetical protein
MDYRYVKRKYLWPFMPAGNMPIPPVEENTERFSAAAVTIGVEPRILTEELVAASGKKPAPEVGKLDDGGVSIHIFVKASDGDRERLRFDCFRNEPHYHYISWRNSYNDHVFIDPTVHSDVLAWALNIIRTRLAQMLEKCDVENAAQYVDQKSLEVIMPLVAEAAYRGFCHVDKERVERAALAAARRA